MAFNREYPINTSSTFFRGLDGSITEFYLVRHGKSVANVAQAHINPIHFKYFLDPELAPPGIVNSGNAGILTEKATGLDNNKYVICSSILLRAQQTAYKMFLEGTYHTLYILPYCGEERGDAMCHYTHELQNDNCPDYKFWKGLLRNGEGRDAPKKELERIGLESLVMRINKGSTLDFDVNIQYVWLHPSQPLGERWLEQNTKVMEPPDVDKFATTLNTLFRDTGKVPVIVTHSHFLMRILELPEKPANNAIFKFERIDSNMFRVSEIKAKDMISSGGGRIRRKKYNGRAIYRKNKRSSKIKVSKKKLKKKRSKKNRSKKNRNNKKMTQIKKSRVKQH